MHNINLMRHALSIALLISLVASSLHATVFTVDTTSDSITDTGSLRYAITNLAAGTNTIQFDIPTTDPGYANGAWTIQPATVLPPITEQVTITGYSFVGAAYNTATPNTLSQGDNAVLQIILNGSANTVGDPITGGNGLTFSAGSNGSVVRGLVINQWAAYGILVDGTAGSLSNIEVNGNFIGTDQTGMIVQANRAGVGFNGYINPGSNLSVGTTAFADRNIIAGSYAPFLNASDGLTLIGSACIVSNTNINTSIVNNYIGTDRSGTVALGNSSYGVFLISDTGSIIGGATKSALNVISGQTVFGIRLGGCSSVTVQNNLIGTDITGTQALGNLNAGIEFENANFSSVAGNTIIGNVISGNGTGIRLGDMFAPGSINNVIQNNKIGTDISGTRALGNTRFGIEVADSTNTVTGNVISGNLGGGLLLYSVLATGEIVTANLIGTDYTGTKSIPNLGNGVQIGIQGAFAGYSTANTIGS